MRISDWSSDVCSSDLALGRGGSGGEQSSIFGECSAVQLLSAESHTIRLVYPRTRVKHLERGIRHHRRHGGGATVNAGVGAAGDVHLCCAEIILRPASGRSEAHTSELQSLMRISYAVFC